MVAKVQITTTVGEDGSVRLLKSQIEPAGIRAGDRVRIEIVKDADQVGPAPLVEASDMDRPDVLDADALAALPFDEWLAYGRSLVTIEGLTVEEIRRQGEEAAADEFWELFNRDR